MRSTLTAAAVLFCACLACTANAPAPESVAQPATPPGGGASDAGPAPTTSRAAAAWRWENPRPTGMPLRGVWGAASDDVWGVGGSRTLVHFDGTSWNTVVSPVQADLLAVWGSGPADVWAAGEGGTVLHYDGSDWISLHLGTAALGSISGTGPDDVWISSGAMPKTFYDIHVAAVPGAALFHFDGKTWTAVPVDGPTAVAALARDDAWVGGCGSIRHFDGRGWTSYPTPEGCVTSVAGIAGGPVAAVNLSEAICEPHDPASCPGYALLAFNGSSWASVAGPAGFVAKIGGRLWAGPGPLMALTFPTELGVFDGNAFREVAATTVVDATILALGPAGDEPWMAGEAGLTLRYDGSSLAEPRPSARQKNWAIAGFDDCDLWAVGNDGQVLRRDCQGTWSSVQVDFPANAPFGQPQLISIAVTPAGEVFILASYETVHRLDGPHWLDEGLIGARKLFASQTGDVFAATSTGLKRRGLDGWAPVGGDTTAWDDVFAISANDVWTQTSGIVHHFDGDRWSLSLNTGDRLAFLFAGFAGSSAHDVWACTQAELWHFDGASWSRIPMPAAAAVSIASAGPGKVFVYNLKTVYAFDGSAWTDLHLPLGTGKTGSEGIVSTATSVYLFGDDGTLLSHPR